MLNKLYKYIKDLFACFSQVSINQENTINDGSPLNQDDSPVITHESPTVSAPCDISTPPKPDISNDPLGNKPWIKLAEECVELFDELDQQIKFFDPPRSEIANHVCCRLQEMLQRSGVELIAETALFDRTLHQPEIPTSGISNGADTAIILSPGFHVGRRILRRARVELQHSGPNQDNDSDA